MSRLIFLFLWTSLLAVTTNAATVLGAKPEQTLYPIDAGDRGTQIYNSFNSSSISGGTNLPYYVLQTSLTNPTLPNASTYKTYQSIKNGIIPYVQTMTQTTYNTLLIVGYAPPLNSSQQSIIQYVVVPSDEILILNYFPINYGPVPNIQTPFTSTVSPGTIPYFSVDPTERAVDIVSAVTTLMTTLKNTATNSQVYVQTTLNGPYNPPIPNGLLQNIVSVSYSGALIQFTFQTNPQQVQQTVLVAPEQVQQIIYVLRYGQP